MLNSMKCIVCGTIFPLPKRNYTRSKYCSPKCRVIFYNRKYQAKNTERNRLKKIEEAKIPDKDKLQCLICGLWFKKVGRHIWNTHKMTAREYREEQGLDVKRGLLPERGLKIMREHVFNNGTLENLKAGKKNWFKKGQPGVGVYKRSEQTLERLKVLYKYNKK